MLSQEHPTDSHWIITAALPAFLLEVAFYLLATFEQTRWWFARSGSRPLQAGVLCISAIAPYLVFSLLTDTFERNAFFLLVLLTSSFAFWHVVLPRRPAYDFGFLIIAAAPLISHVFPRIYISPDSHLRVDVLGHMMWIRVGIVALLTLRQWNPGSFSLWPRLREWKIGAAYYLIVLIPISILALDLHDVRFAPVQRDPWQVGIIAVGTFFGILWVVALGEELFFRGVIANALMKIWPPLVAVSVSAILFGCAHLWFHQFPNWRRALVATVLGLACGAAYVQTGSVRAPMVTHAFVVTTWRLFFQ